MNRILIIEDDYKLRQTIKMSLEVEGYEVHITDDYENIEQVFRELTPDLTLLDIQLPYLDGFIICKLLRKISDSPIIIMSARNTDDEQIFGIELGADEYIVKPFSMGLLKAKIKAMLRRTKLTQSNPETPKLLKAGELRLDTHRMTLHNKDKSISLSKNEYILLKIFFRSINKVIKREELMMELWDDEHFIDENTLNVNIRRVKSRLEDVGVSDAIQTRRGVGYIFEIEDAAS